MSEEMDFSESLNKRMDEIDAERFTWEDFYEMLPYLDPSNMVDLDPDFSDMVDENFWNLVDTNEREDDE